MRFLFWIGMCTVRGTVNIFLRAVSLVALALLSGCAGLSTKPATDQVAKPSVQKTAVVNSALNDAGFYYLTQALTHELNGEPRQAFELYMRTAQQYKWPEIYARAHALTWPTSPEAAMYVAQKWAADHPQDSAAQKALAEASTTTAAMYYQRGVGLQNAGKTDEGASALRRAIAADANFAPALNALGYFLADQGKNLDEAQNLIARALAISPREGAYLDSMGWVLFRQGKPQAALTWLEKSFAAYPDAEVGAHLLEVEYALGNAIKATEWARKALKLDAKHPVLLETLKRLNLRLE